ncbi:hypothetical protein EMIT0357P_70039 [Pseudomonas marginalis]
MVALSCGVRRILQKLPPAIRNNFFHTPLPRVTLGLAPFLTNGVVKLIAHRALPSQIPNYP